MVEELDFLCDLTKGDKSFLNTRNLCCWRPDEAWLKRIAALAPSGDVKRMREVLTCSLDRCCCDLDEVDLSTTLEAPQTFSDAFQALGTTSNQNGVRALEGGILQSQPQGPWKSFAQYLDQEVVIPLIQEAMGIADPTERNLRLMAAMLSRVCHLQAFWASDELSRALSRQDVSRLRAFPEASLKTLFEAHDRVLKTYQELNRCEENHAPLVVEVREAHHNCPRLGHCD